MAKQWTDKQTENSQWQNDNKQNWTVDNGKKPVIKGDMAWSADDTWEGAEWSAEEWSDDWEDAWDELEEDMDDEQALEVYLSDGQDALSRFYSGGLKRRDRRLKKAKNWQ